MSYSLKQPENTLTDLDGGAWIIARPLITPVLEAAKAVATRQWREAKENPELLAAMGLQAADGADAEIGQSIYLLFLRIELGNRLIESWTGFGDEAEAAATPENIRTVFCLYPTVGKKFYDDIIRKAALRAVVKKNSASAAPGTSNAVPETPIAANAVKTTPIVHGDFPD